MASPLDGAIGLVGDRLNYAFPAPEPLNLGRVGQNAGALKFDFGPALPAMNLGKFGGGNGIDLASGFSQGGGSALKGLQSAWTNLTQPKTPSAGQPNTQSQYTFSAPPGRSGVGAWQDRINSYAQQANVPPLLLAASMMSESGGNQYSRNATQPSYGLFHAHTEGRGAGYTEEQLYDPDLQFKLAVPEFQSAWQAAQQMSFPDDQSRMLWAIGRAQRYEDWQNPQSAGSQNVLKWLQALQSGQQANPNYQTMELGPNTPPGHFQTMELGPNTPPAHFQTMELGPGTYQGGLQNLPATMPLPAQPGGVNQFAQGLDPQTAAAFCGPAAAMAFMQATGRTPSAQEALQLAREVGWTPGGMAGPDSELALLQRMGADAYLENTVDWNKVQQEVQAHRPVIIDTPDHYFQVLGYDPQSGQYNFGPSASELRPANGRSWFLPDELPNLRLETSTTPRSALYLRPPAQAPTQAPAPPPMATPPQDNATLGRNQDVFGIGYPTSFPGLPVPEPITNAAGAFFAPVQAFDQWFREHVPGYQIGHQPVRY